MKTYNHIVSNFNIVDDVVKQNIHFNETFTVKETNYSAQVIYREQKLKDWYSFDANKFEVLGAASVLRAYLRRLPDNFIKRIPNVEPKNIKYFYFSSNVQDLEKCSGDFMQFENVVEIDLIAAYFHAALKMKIISPDVFDKIVYVTKVNKVTGQIEKTERSKADRLKILGSMAVKTEINSYKNGELIYTKFKTTPCKNGDGCTHGDMCPVFRNLWFNICKKIDDLFQKVMKVIPAKYILFYFVDGIFLVYHPEIVSKIENIFTRADYPYKKIMIDNFTVTNKNKRLIIDLKKSNGKEKKFIIPHREVIHYYIN